MTETRSLETRHDSETGTRRSYLLVLLIFLPFLVLAVLYVKISLQCIFVRNDIGYPEGASIYAFLTAFRTGRLYSSPYNYPWNAEIYGPVFYLIGSIFARVARGDPTLTTELARLLSFLSFLGSVGLVGFLSWRLEGCKRWTAITVVLGLACGWAAPFASARPDYLSIFLILGALTIYEVARGRSRLIFWVGILGTLSCLTKQSTAPVLLALAIDCLIARRFRNCTALIAGSVPVPFLIFSMLWLRHEPFLANFLVVGHVVFNWPGAVLTTINLVRTNQIDVIPIALGLLGAGLSWKNVKYRPILLVGAFAWLVNLAALANTGGSSNYLILPWMLTILSVPTGLARIEEWTRRSILIPLGLTLLGGFFLIHQRNLLPKLPADLDTYDVDQMKALSSLSYLEMRSRQPQLLDPLLYHHLFLQNVGSIAPIVRQIDDEEYDLILIEGEDGPSNSEFLVKSFRGASFWGADTLGPMASHYRALCEVPDFIALVPRDRAGALQDKDIARIFAQPCLATGRTPQLAPGVR
ncbi:MAG: hypothetical protein ABR912_08195 [Terracidiphilus sp.]|jgi:hypothetical protein